MENKHLLVMVENFHSLYDTVNYMVFSDKNWDGVIDIISYLEYQVFR